MTEQNKAGDATATGEQTDYKAEFEKLKTEHDGLKKSNEELRLEFMSEEYLNFLENKETHKPASKAEVKAPVVPDDEWEKLTKKQVYEKALKDAEDKINSKFNEIQEAQKTESKAQTLSEVKKFFTNNPEAETYRSVMAGLASDPKYADLNLDELYKKSISYVKSLAGASEEEKAKSRKSAGEKPGSSSSSFKKAASKLSADEANEAAWEEVVGDKGLPTAF